MSNKYNYLYQYLEKEEIIIYKKEFEFQIKFHPDYPSLLAIVDTLTYFNIDNCAIRLGSSEIDLLPTRFIVFLKEENNTSKLYSLGIKKKTFLSIKKISC